MTTAPAEDIRQRIARASQGVATLHKRERGMMNLGNCALCHRPEHPGACMRKSEKGPAPDMGGKKAPGSPGKPGKQLPQDKGSGGEIKGTGSKLGKEETSCFGGPKNPRGTKGCPGKACKECGGKGTKKAEPAMGAKPPSGQNPAKPAAPKTGSPKVGAPPAAPGMTKAEMEAGAAHHYAGLFAAMLHKSDEAAQQHARLYTAYERALGNDPLKGVSTSVKSRASTHAPLFAQRMLKNERGFLGYQMDHLIKAIIPPPGAPQPAKPAQPMGTKPAPAGAAPGKTLMQMRQNAFGRSKTAGAAPPSAGSPGASAKPPGSPAGPPKPAAPAGASPAPAKQ